MRPGPKKLKKNSLFIIFKKLTSYRKYEKKKKKKKNTHTNPATLQVAELEVHTFVADKCVFLRFHFPLCGVLSDGGNPARSGALGPKAQTWPR